MSLRYPGIPRVEVWPGPLFSFTVERRGAPDPSDVERREWDRLGAGNPRLFDGPILAVRSVDEHSRTVRLAPDRYLRLATRDASGSGIAQLAVRALVQARDARGETRSLLLRRGGGTRVYAGLWETGPAGGVPPGDSPSVELGALLHHLADEMREEAAIELAGAAVSVMGMLLDHDGGGFDAVFRVDLPAALEQVRLRHAEAWECDGARWESADALCALDARAPGSIIPPARAMLRMAGIVPDPSDRRG